MRFLLAAAGLGNGVAERLGDRLRQLATVLDGVLARDAAPAIITLRVLSEAYRVGDGLIPEQGTQGGPGDRAVPQGE